ncbi:hypothetical protein EHYA_08577 [Embleya hyalina]|uniref:Uncharacterized protein n=1 Tax=Embleya hyalina TaxID=516124 RepID=A0A401Z248_9ACTN|nr:hypothetical protein EHYA_08577 [Embleya hyalina]
METAPRRLPGRDTPSADRPGGVEAPKSWKAEVGPTERAPREPFAGAGCPARAGAAGDERRTAGRERRGRPTHPAPSRTPHPTRPRGHSRHGDAGVRRPPGGFVGVRLRGVGRAAGARMRASPGHPVIDRPDGVGYRGHGRFGNAVTRPGEGQAGHLGKGHRLVRARRGEPLQHGVEVDLPLAHGNVQRAGVRRSGRQLGNSAGASSREATAASSIACSPGATAKCQVAGGRRDFAGFEDGAVGGDLLGGFEVRLEFGVLGRCPVDADYRGGRAPCPCERRCRALPVWTSRMFSRSAPGGKWQLSRRARSTPAASTTGQWRCRPRSAFRYVDPDAPGGTRRSRTPAVRW